MAKTKAELVEEVKYLKGLVKKSAEELKKIASSDSGDLPFRAIGVFVADDKKFKKVIINYNPETKASKVDLIEDVHHVAPNTIHMADFAMKKLLSEIIDDVTKGRGNK